MVDGFLSALLTSSSDPSRYLAPGVDVPASGPAPFTSITIDEIGVAQLEEPALAIHVWLSVTTPGGSRQSVFYEIVAAERDDRWEVLSLSGAPTVRAPAPPDTGTDPQATAGTSSAPRTDGLSDGAATADEPGEQVPAISAPATTGTTVVASPGV